ncbi:hypothetical protein [Vitiosangium sp. GDMCC 1.1324]|uniref:hypothetical protein n=1 Tax=Vitiosangium sp. (strain GDMCC 1.1324) TaxID=2138576 RepID=UPI000D35D7E3|nr:hypothetical protein [Vitiosangium sp. GDMCC 1.1324]PTL84034.1 hypothetical protein DAT35_11310 [Vitiosangium sp. GDMCC 1.1324]
MKKTESELESRVIRGAHGVAAEEDHILTGKVVQVGVGALVIFIVGGIWAWRLQVATTHEFAPEGPAPIPALITPDKNHHTAYEIGIVNQRLFDVDTHAVEKIHSQQQALENGWAEEPGVVARPTISQAMDQVIAKQAAGRQQPAPAPTPTPAPQQPAPQRQ